MIGDNIQFVLGGQALSKTNPVPTQEQTSVKATYGIASQGNTPVAATTDIATLTASTTKTVQVKRVTVSGQAATAGSMNVSLVKRTAANTGGTSTTVTAGQFDSTDAAPTAVAKLYTANPSALGAGIPLSVQTLNFGVAGAAGTVVFDFANRNDKPIILKTNTAENLAINLNGGTVPATGLLSYTIEFEEV
jgi:hypothetical protein